MSRFLPAYLSALLLAGGCMTVQKATDFRNVKVDSDRTPVAIIEIENSVWLLFNFIPLASGNPNFPNEASCCFFRSSVNLASNMKVLHSEMRISRVHEVANLTSRYTDEKYLFFLLARRACHTSAVLVAPAAEEESERNTKAETPK